MFSSFRQCQHCINLFQLRFNSVQHLFSSVTTLFQCFISFERSFHTISTFQLSVKAVFKCRQRFPTEFDAFQQKYATVQLISTDSIVLQYSIPSWLAVSVSCLLALVVAVSLLGLVLHLSSLALQVRAFPAAPVIIAIKT